MRTTLSSVGCISAASTRHSVSEAEGLHDACRAYGLLLHSSQLREIQEHSEVSTQVNVIDTSVGLRCPALCDGFQSSNMS